MPAPSPKTKFRKALAKLREDVANLSAFSDQPWWEATNADRIASIGTSIDGLARSVSLDMEPAADKAARKAKAAEEDTKPKPGDRVRVRAGLPEYSSLPQSALDGWTLVEVRGNTAVCSIVGMPDPLYVQYSHLEVVAS